MKSKNNTFDPEDSALIANYLLSRLNTNEMFDLILELDEMVDPDKLSYIATYLLNDAEELKSYVQTLEIKMEALKLYLEEIEETSKEDKAIRIKLEKYLREKEVKTLVKEML